MGENLTGGCQCGALRYQVTGAPLTLYLCHCTECQKQSASAFGMSLWVRRADFALTAGTPRFWERRADSGRRLLCAFCDTCGSRVYHAASHDSEVLSLKAGSLDDTSGLRPVGHIWTRSRQPWVDTGDVPAEFVYAREPESFQPLIERWTARARGG